MKRLFIPAPIKLSGHWPDHYRAKLKPSGLKLAAGLLIALPALLVSGCEQTADTSAPSANHSGQQTAEAAQSDSSTQSLWRYQNTRMGDNKGDEEIYAEAAQEGSTDPLITPIHRRSAHSSATLEAAQINQDQASRSVTLSIKTDPTHGRYVTLSDPKQSFDCQPSCTLRARFDAGDSQNFTLQSNDPHQLFLLTDTQANRLVDQIKTAQTLQLNIPVKPSPSNTTYTFDVRGLDLGQITL